MNNYIKKITLAFVICRIEWSKVLDTVDRCRDDFEQSIMEMEQRHPGFSRSFLRHAHDPQFQSLYAPLFEKRAKWLELQGQAEILWKHFDRLGREIVQAEESLTQQHWQIHQHKKVAYHQLRSRWVQFIYHVTHDLN
jgi:hypothetical protein